MHALSAEGPPLPLTWNFESEKPLALQVAAHWLDFFQILTPIAGTAMTINAISSQRSTLYSAALGDLVGFIGNEV